MWQAPCRRCRAVVQPSAVGRRVAAAVVPAAALWPDLGQGPAVSVAPDVPLWSFVVFSELPRCIPEAELPSALPVPLPRRAFLPVYTLAAPYLLGSVPHRSACLSCRSVPVPQSVPGRWWADGTAGCQAAAILAAVPVPGRWWAEGTAAHWLSRAEPIAAKDQSEDLDSWTDPVA